MESEGEEDFSQWRSEQNRKQKKAGGWQNMGLDHTVFKGIERKGYRQPTPIQRKTIPCVLDGKDVVAMSRTGSGKTAAFVIPMLHKLKRRETAGIRALLVSPTRELALQTFKVVKELGKFTGLRCAVLVGGDLIEEQFAAIHENPDILIATPGRLLHVVVEMNLRLSRVQLVVFDEADRLFEMGFQDQLIETLKRIPEGRQTLLFSATLPKLLVDFAKAGLSDPMLIRLDVDEKISDKLSMVFLLCRCDQKLAVLLSLCRQMDRERKQTLVFCATMKHVEYVAGILNRAGVSNAFIYSQLDAAARKQNMQRFAERKCNILVVTDVAARGVDIPLLDTVINLHFPSKSKLFVHRAGRVARAGRSGTAISLIASDELPYMTDLFLFLSKPIIFSRDDDKYQENVTLIGRVPESITNLEADFFTSIHDSDAEMTIFELNVATKAEPAAVMKAKRREHESRIRQVAEEKAKQKEDIEKDRKEAAQESNMKKRAETMLQQADEKDIEEAFAVTVGSGKKRKAKASNAEKKLNSREEMKKRDKEFHFVPYASSDYQSEKQLALQKTDFAKQAEGAVVDLIADEEDGLRKQNNVRRWDRKKKKFVGTSEEEQVKKIRTEEGTWLPATYKTGIYEEWKEKQKIAMRKEEDEEGEAANWNVKRKGKWNRFGKKGSANGPQQQQVGVIELYMTF
ncbi:hypothetical protein WR25_25111 isoform B [Diploscapter pachys]|uniref:RNA helicase n=1 Tax=Diploscapter pachys TaxID=2018661 RepID=A0A2A2LCD3_9BILA|nr:hypothetical protein WR25_25111 isoform B [Diploscapter pachys]